MSQAIRPPILTPHHPPRHVLGRGGTELPGDGLASRLHRPRPRRGPPRAVHQRNDARRHVLRPGQPADALHRCPSRHGHRQQRRRQRGPVDVHEQARDPAGSVVPFVRRTVHFHRPRLGGDAGRATCARALRPLTADAVDDFVAVERPSGGLEGRYARVRATLRQRKYRGNELFDVATRIVEDGVDHFGIFSRMRAIVDVYDQSPPAHLRPNFTLGSPDNALVARASRGYREVITLLTEGYGGDAPQVDQARRAMLDLENLIEDCAGEGLGVPYFS